MEFKDQVKQLSERVEKLKGKLETEEATKNSLVLPFLQALGYDVFNPLEIVPEFTCDVGTKKGEKVDYAIMKEDDAIVLIECKHWAQDLSLHDNQLLRYFQVSKAKFGILTNGIIYKFYTDLVERNLMDTKPFLEINISNVRDYQIEELKKFHKSHFNIESIFNSAAELKYMSELRIVIQEEFKNPSIEFTKLFLRKVYDGQATQKMIDQFTPLVKKTIATYTNDLITERIKGALDANKENNEVEEIVSPSIPNDGIVTTEEELEGFMIVKAILYADIDIARVAYRDSKSYFAILFDDNNRKPICRFFFNGTKKHIVTFNENKEETRHDIETLNDIYYTSEALKSIVRYYLNT